MFLVTRLWDAVNDPVVGVLADKTRTRWGRFRPWLLWAAVPFAVLGVLSFSTPDLGDTGKLVYAYVTYSLLMLAYTAVNIPLASLLGVASSDPDVRTRLAGWKMFGGFTASLIAQVFSLKLVEVLGGGTDVASKQVGFQYTTFLYSGIAVVALLYTFFVVKERIAPDRGDPVPLATQFRQLATSRAWLVLLGVFMTMCLFMSIRGASSVYFLKYYLGLTGDNVDLFGFEVTQGTAVGIFLGLGSVGCLIGTPFMAPMASRFGKRWAFMFMLAMSAVVAAVHYPLVGRDGVAIAFVLNALVGLFSGPIFVLTNAMLTDVADEMEARHGHRPTGLVFSASSFSFKFGWTVGGAAAGWVLAYYAFQPNEEQTPEALEGIRLMMSLLPMIPMAIAAGLLFLYPLNKEQLAVNRRILEAREGGEEAPAEALSPGIGGPEGPPA